METAFGDYQLCLCRAGIVGLLLNIVNHLLTINSFVFGVVYWFIWTRLLPRYGRYTLKERAGILDDGTVINRFVHVPKK